MSLREFRTQALFENVSAPSFHFSLDFVGSGRETRAENAETINNVQLSSYTLGRTNSFRDIRTKDVIFLYLLYIGV